MINDTMFNHNFETIKEIEFLDINNSPRWKKAIRETSIGLPKRHEKYRKTSQPLVRHAQGLKIFEQYSGTKIDEIEYIFEFGGGYGGMCRVVHQLGFKGTYSIFDFPELNVLQEYYLKSSNLNVRFGVPGATEKGVFLISDLKDLESIIPNESHGLFIANWSISETPIEFRDAFFKNNIFNKINRYLIVFQHKHCELDNIQYFSRFQTLNNNISWKTQELTTQRNSYYLIGF
jgi:hypothetical protein